MEIAIAEIHAPIEPDHASAIADRDMVDVVLKGLDPRGRAIVVLHYYLGLPLTDVAGALGIPVGTVKSRLHRALGEMRASVPPDSTPRLSGIPERNLA
jgi:RNA polymerase sigma-70 factor (ECF subfamily)